ncbi:sulfurtransferase complex subunit TusC [uncultured Paraglaciecola sp.]|uniref:sulfurtransferase complex subunit TusC n=1 Tax=uncultured Paraglaciecola sp. TaxID=1765024 RepID=UPI002606DD63|nr:sulfurtransferase complex subunit TusC [uncultured Paraglaciecola sp.]
MAASIAIVNKSAPYGSINGQESLDMALAMSNFGQEVSLFFIEDAVFQLVKQQTPDKIDHKAYHKTFAALNFYDIDNIYVCQHSLQKRNLSEADLCIDVTLIKPSQLTGLLASSNHVMVF